MQELFLGIQNGQMEKMAKGLGFMACQTILKCLTPTIN